MKRRLLGTTAVALAVTGILTLPTVAFAEEGTSVSADGYEPSTLITLEGDGAGDPGCEAWINTKHTTGWFAQGVVETWPGGLCVMVLERRIYSNGAWGNWSRLSDTHMVGGNKLKDNTYYYWDDKHYQVRVCFTSLDGTTTRICGSGI